MISEILWLLFWPVFIFISSFLVQLAVKKFEQKEENTPS